MNNIEKDFYKTHEEAIKDHIYWDDELDETISTIHDSNLNFNNADPTTGQRCNDRHEIEKLLESGINHLKEEDDRCGSCAHIIQYEDFENVYEARECWGAPCTESVCVGYECSHCGFKKEY